MAKTFDVRFTAYGESVDGVAAMYAEDRHRDLLFAEDTLLGSPLESAICRAIDSHWRDAEALATGALPHEIPQARTGRRGVDCCRCVENVRQRRPFGEG